MKKMLLCAAALIAVPAQSAVLLPGASNVVFDSFDLPANFATQGTQLAYRQDLATALTFQALVRSAVYRNTGGTLDFYYQVMRTGVGSDVPGENDHEIFTMTAAQYHSFTTFAYAARTTDVDGAGNFTTAMNPGPGGFTSLAARSANGQRVEVEFGTNGLDNTDTSAVYIFRTNAVSFKRGTFGLIDGSAIGGPTFAPTVPEPATWAMMIGGFGLLGAAARRSSRARSVLA